MTDEPPPTEEELMEARRRLLDELEKVENPMSARNENPFLADRLRTMIAEIEDILGMPDDDEG